MNPHNKKLFLFDIDGTLALGDTLLPGADALLKYIDSIGGKSYFITNNSTKSGADYVKRFRSVFGLETTEDQFVTSGYMMKAYLLKHYKNQLIYVQGTESYLDDLRREGLQITDAYEREIACVVVAYDSELSYEKISLTCQILEELDVPFFATNPDLRCPVPFGYIPDCGAICNMITSTCDKEPIYLGKPNPAMVSLCQKLSGFSDAQTLVIGDRLYTDIACGINAKVDTCVLLTGEARMEDLADTHYKPDFVYETVNDLFQALTNNTIS